MAQMVSRLRLPLQVQDVLLAVFVTLFQILGTQRAALNQPAARGSSACGSVPRCSVGS
jgi:hypothetical protein